jgi:1-acyl-sn-glycerol-3-phosphate acyltransferase
LGISIIRVRGKARKYRRNPNSCFLDQRYHFLYAQVKKLLFLKRITVLSNGVTKIPSSPCLFVYNHKSNIDAVILLKYLLEYRNTVNPNFKFVFIGKTELQKKRNFIKDTLDLADTIYIDRADLRQQFKMFEKQNERIKDKYSIVIAPEGTRNKEDDFGEFKPGSIKVAFHNMIPIQPIVL